MSKRVQLVSDNDRLFPVQAFFNSVSASSFVTIIQSLLQGVGVSINDAHAEFPGEVEPGEKPFRGVRFSLYEDEVVVEEAVFKQFLLAACKAHLREHPEERSELSQVLSKRGWASGL